MSLMHCMGCVVASLTLSLTAACSFQECSRVGPLCVSVDTTGPPLQAEATVTCSAAGTTICIPLHYRAPHTRVLPSMIAQVDLPLVAIRSRALYKSLVPVVTVVSMCIIGTSGTSSRTFFHGRSMPHSNANLRCRPFSHGDQITRSPS